MKVDGNQGASKLGNSLGNKARIVVEIGQAYEGSESFAHAHIDEVAKSGADAVKFQLHIARAESSLDDVFRTEERFRRESRFEYWSRHELSPHVMEDLVLHAKERDLQVGFSTFSLEGLERVQCSEADFLKIGSGEAIQEWFLRAASEVDLPVVLSTGLSTLDEIGEAVELLNSPARHLTLLQCVTRYPSKFEDVGLNVIPELKTRFGLEVGISDHSGVLAPAVFAISNGASMVEVHGTFSKKSRGLDAESSLDFDEIALLVQMRDAWSTMSQHPVEKDVVSEELHPMRKVFGRSLAAARVLEPGENTSVHDFYFAKPGGGIPPEELDSFVGKTVQRKVDAHKILRREDVG